MKYLINPPYIIFYNGIILSKATGSYRLLKHTPCSRGYVTTNYFGKTVRVHRVIAESFCPKKPGASHVNHIDGNKRNNHSSNLEWVTPLENSHHYVTKILKKELSGRYFGSAKNRKRRQNSFEKVFLVKTLALFVPCHASIARELGFKYESVRRIIKGKTFVTTQRDVESFWISNQ
jgi:hypothetical protein